MLHQIKVSVDDLINEETPEYQRELKVTIRGDRRTVINAEEDIRKILDQLK